MRDKRIVVIGGSSGMVTPASLGMTIKNAQIALNRLGYDAGPVDNVYGRITRSAVVRFQRAQHLAVTGALGGETWNAIVAQLIAVPDHAAK